MLYYVLGKKICNMRKRFQTFVRTYILARTENEKNKTIYYIFHQVCSINYYNFVCSANLKLQELHKSSALHSAGLLYTLRCIAALISEVSACPDIQI